MRSRGGPTVLILVVALVGCEGRPRAPALTSESVYENDAAGIRFLVPEGWVVSGKSSLPPGKFDKPIRLVSYSATAGPGGLDLYAIDLPAGQELPAYLDQHAIGAEKWLAKGAGKSITVDGIAATHYLHTSKKGDRTRELTAFARKDRTFVLVLSYATSDSGNRDLGRRAVESTTWR